MARVVLVSLFVVVLAAVATLPAAGTSEGVRYLGLMLMPEDEVVFFVFSGPSADAVRALAASAAIPFERIVESVRVAGPNEREGT